MARTSTRIDLSGDFFTKDPDKVVSDNVQDMLTDLAKWAEGAVKSDVASHAGSMPFYSGWTRDSIEGRVHADAGKSWTHHMVVSANTSGMGRDDAIRTKAAAATIERRWHPFRRVTAGIRRARPVIQADLTKGLG